jgi:PAS domain S-box-containing protein
VKRPRVLVVEDNPVIAETIRHFLNKCDYSIAGMAPTGEQAVELAGTLKPDLVLMDVELAAEMAGIEAAGLIWSRFQSPVIFLTANDDEETISRAARTEAYGYLHKPVRERELSSTLQIALSKHEAELRVHEQTRWLQTTLECIAEAVIAADSVGCVKFLNPAAERLTGWTQAQAIGLDLMDVYRVLDCETRRPAECAVVEVIRGGAAPHPAQVRILVAKNGAEALVEETAAPIINAAGHITGVVLVFRCTDAGVNAA